MKDRRADYWKTRASRLTEFLHQRGLWEQYEVWVSSEYVSQYLEEVKSDS